jgi:hypothetical protein
MAGNAFDVIAALGKAKNSLSKVLSDCNKIKEKASAVPGEIGRVVPPQIDLIIANLNNILDNNQPIAEGVIGSFESMVDYLGNMPLRSSIQEPEAQVEPATSLNDSYATAENGKTYYVPRKTL